MIALRTYVAATAVTLACMLPCGAFARGGSMEDQMACTPDVYRLCASKIPDEDAIVACLTQHKTSLSAACGKVFSRPDPGSTAPSNDDDDDQ